MLAVDLSAVHGNREVPGYFDAYMAVPDVNLPLKGTAFRPAAGELKDTSVKVNK